MKLWMMPALLVISICADAATLATQPLFFIERTLNANIVRFEAQLTREGMLDAEEPVIAYWLMNAEDGRRESLTLIEKTTAYGFSVKPDVNPGSYLLTVVSFKDRPIRVFLNGERARAQMTINGATAFLEKVFIRASGAYSRPHFIEFHGKDAATGEERVERVSAD